jgi:hypothetical protein
MTHDPDIFRAAKLMIDQHGDEAALQAAQRADELLEDGDLEGSVVWRRIAASQLAPVPPPHRGQGICPRRCPYRHDRGPILDLKRA